jgi:hypothetical protein
MTIRETLKTVTTDVFGYELYFDCAKSSPSFESFSVESSDTIRHEGPMKVHLDLQDNAVPSHKRAYPVTKSNIDVFKTI